MQCLAQRVVVVAIQSKLADTVLELERSMHELSISIGTLPGRLLTDVASPIPSLSHVWLFCVLRRMSTLEPLLSIAIALYNQFTPTISFNCQAPSTFPTTSGIKQCCPLTGSLFASGLDPLARRFLAQVTLRSARLMDLSKERLRRHRMCACVCHCA